MEGTGLQLGCPVQGRNILDVDIFTLAYYLAYGLFLFSGLYTSATFDSFFGMALQDFLNGFQAVALVLLVIKFISQRASFRGWCLALGIVAVGFVSWRASDEGFLFWAALFIVCSDRVNVRVLAAISLVVVSLLTALTFTFACAGVIENRVVMRDGVARLSMGFFHPNNFGSKLLLICASAAVLRYGKDPLPIMPICLIAAALCYTLANSRTSAALCVLIGVLSAIFYVTDTRTMQRRLSIGFLVLAAALILFSLYAMIFFDSSNGFQAALDEALSGRLRWAHAYYKLQPLTLFGSDFEDVPMIYYSSSGELTKFVVDNAYAHLVLRFGLIPSAIFFIGLFALFLCLVKQQRWDYMLFGLTLMTILGFMEKSGIQVDCNYFIVAMGTELIFSERGVLAKTGVARRT